MSTLSEALSTLKFNKYKLTPQRKAILNVLDTQKRRMTPAEVHKEVVKQNPRINLVTIYRTLNILANLGLACEIRASSISKSYVIGNPDIHGHLVCTDCGKVIDFEDYDLSELTQSLNNKYSYTIMGHRLDFFGLCPDCAQR